MRCQNFRVSFIQFIGDTIDPWCALSFSLRTKSFTSPSFSGELSNVFSGGCGLLNSPNSPPGLSVSGSEYFLCKCASKVSFGTLRTPFFLLKQLLGKFKCFFFSKARLPFLFLTTVSLYFPLVIWQGFFPLYLKNVVLLNSCYQVFPSAVFSDAFFRI